MTASPRKKPPRAALRHIIVIVFFFAPLFFLLGCVPEGENSVSTRLVRPVVVSVEGDVVDATTRLPLEGMQVEIVRRALGADAGASPTETEADASADVAPVLTEATGRFLIPAVELDVEKWEYGVRVRDVSATPRYRSAEATGVYDSKTSRSPCRRCSWSGSRTTTARP